MNERNARAGARDSSWCARVAWTSARSWRTTRSSFRLATLSSAPSIASTCALRRRVVRVVGIEAQLEEIHQHARDRRMRGERLLHERLRYREADLVQVLGVRAQHGHFVGGEPRAQDQAVEVVVFHLAAENALERLLEDLVDRVDVEIVVPSRLQAEVVHPHRGTAFGLDAIGTVVEHGEPHVLEHRQAVRQRHRRAALEEREAQRAGLRLQRPVEAQAQRPLVAQRPPSSRYRRPPRAPEILAVGRRERGRVFAKERVAARFAERGHERGLQRRPPSAARLPRAGARSRARRSRAARRAGAHRDEHARERRLGEIARRTPEDVPLNASVRIACHLRRTAVL